MQKGNERGRVGGRERERERGSAECLGPCNLDCKSLWLKWNDMKWSKIVWHGVIWEDVMWCDVMWCDVMWCDVVWYEKMWCDVMWCDVIRYERRIIEEMERKRRKWKRGRWIEKEYKWLWQWLWRLLACVVFITYFKYMNTVSLFLFLSLSLSLSCPVKHSPFNMLLMAVFPLYLYYTFLLSSLIFFLTHTSSIPPFLCFSLLDLYFNLTSFSHHIAPHYTEPHHAKLFYTIPYKDAVMDALKLTSIPDQCFDFILDKALLDSQLCTPHNIDNANTLIKEMYRVLSPGEWVSEWFIAMLLLYPTSLLQNHISNPDSCHKTLTSPSV